VAEHRILKRSLQIFRVFSGIFLWDTIAGGGLTAAMVIRWGLQKDNSQTLTIALAAVPNMLAVLVGILINNSRLSDTNARIGELRAHMDARFNNVDRRFDEMRDLWRS
jgi:hypothetical protein